MSELDILYWTMVFTAATAAATWALVWVAWRELGESNRRQRRWETLKACGLYDFDPILNAALLRLRIPRREGVIAKEPLALSFDIVTVLNYLEGLATGVRQGFYDEKVLREHMEPIMAFHVKEFLNPDTADKLGFAANDYETLKNFVAKWTLTPTPWYRL